MPANLENSAVVTGLKKVSFHPIPKRGNAKECSNYCITALISHTSKVMSLLFNMLSRYHTTALISHPSKVMLKILQARLQQYMNRELPNVQAGFRKGRGTRDQMANILWIMENARELQKHLFLLY